MHGLPPQPSVSGSSHAAGHWHVHLQRTFSDRRPAAAEGHREQRLQKQVRMCDDDDDDGEVCEVLCMNLNVAVVCAAWRWGCGQRPIRRRGLTDTSTPPSWPSRCWMSTGNPVCYHGYDLSPWWVNQCKNKFSAVLCFLTSLYLDVRGSDCCGNVLTLTETSHKEWEENVTRTYKRNNRVMSSWGLPASLSCP